VNRDQLADIVSAGWSTVGGWNWAMAEPEGVPAIWGDGGTVGWASGEPLAIVAPQGVGKTTITQQLVLGRVGLRDRVLDMPVTPSKGYVLYLALDRPRQAARSFRRMLTDLTEDEQALVDERVIVWKKPLPFDIGREPELLLDFVNVFGDHEMKVETLIIDSLKDAAMDLVKDDTGTRVNNSIQRVIAEGVEVLFDHHQRKGQQGSGKPRNLEDVYGSTWLTAGCGSVILLWGKPGDPVVELDHLKQPADPIPSLKIVHDHQHGRSRVFEKIDLAQLLEEQPAGMTVKAAAYMLFGEDPSESDVERARRQLNKLVEKGSAERRSPGKPDPDVWFSANHARQSRSNHANHATSGTTSATCCSCSSCSATAQSTTAHSGRATDGRPASRARGRRAGRTSSPCARGRTRPAGIALSRSSLGRSVAASSLTSGRGSNCSPRPASRCTFGGQASTRFRRSPRRCVAEAKVCRPLPPAACARSATPSAMTASPRSSRPSSERRHGHDHHRRRHRPGARQRRRPRRL
jgi:hypothetical protein